LILIRSVGEGEDLDGKLKILTKKRFVEVIIQRSKGNSLMILFRCFVKIQGVAE
jgi:hypothetical protein